MATVTQATVKVNTFKTMYDIVTTSKSASWTLVSSFPESSPAFPCIILNPAKTSQKGHTFRTSGRKYDIQIMIEFYAKSSDRKEAVDSEMDKIREGIFGLESTTLNTAKLVLASEQPIDELEPNTLLIGNNKYHYGALIVYLRLI